MKLDDSQKTDFWKRAEAILSLPLLPWTDDAPKKMNPTIPKMQPDGVFLLDAPFVVKAYFFLMHCVRTPACAHSK